MSNTRDRGSTPHAVAGSQTGPVLLATKPDADTGAAHTMARCLAAREDRPLDIVTVLGRADGVTPAPRGIPRQAERGALADRASTGAASVNGRPGTCRVEILEGLVAPSVVEAASARSARVIVIGAGGQSVAAGYGLGERALEILRIADRPVMIVQSTARVGAVTSAIVAVDFTRSSLRAARAVVPMLARHGCLHLVHVLYSDESRRDREGLSRVAEGDPFRHLLRGLPSMPGVGVATHLLQGDPAAAIAEFARVNDADLIACGWPSSSLVARLFVNDGRRIGALPPCPVLVAPDGVPRQELA